MDDRVEAGTVSGQTITRAGAILPVRVRTARRLHLCDDCSLPIEPGEKYELSVTPPHRLDLYDVDRWLTWRTHYPRHASGWYLLGCDLAAAYQEKAWREQPNRNSDG
jgi:hypothetical protein